MLGKRKQRICLAEFALCTVSGRACIVALAPFDRRLEVLCIAVVIGVIQLVWPDERHGPVNADLLPSNIVRLLLFHVHVARLLHLLFEV